MTAYESGKLTAGTAEVLLRLSPADQLAELRRRQAALQYREQRAKGAARIIADYLDRHDRIDLHALRSALRELPRLSGRFVRE